MSDDRRVIPWTELADWKHYQGPVASRRVDWGEVRQFVGAFIGFAFALAVLFGVFLPACSGKPLIG